MRGKLVGFEKFQSKKGEAWVNLCFAVDRPDSVEVCGVIVNKYMCRPSVVPNLNKDMVGKNFMFSTSNNFLNDMEMI